MGSLVQFYLLVWYFNYYFFKLIILDTTIYTLDMNRFGVGLIYSVGLRFLSFVVLTNFFCRLFRSWLCLNTHLTMRYSRVSIMNPILIIIFIDIITPLWLLSLLLVFKAIILLSYLVFLERNWSFDKLSWILIFHFGNADLVHVYLAKIIFDFIEWLSHILIHILNLLVVFTCDIRNNWINLFDLVVVFWCTIVL